MQVLFGFFVLLILLWSLYSAICLIYPFKPIRTRGRALASLVLSIGLLGAVGAALPEPDTFATEESAQTEIVISSGQSKETNGSAKNEKAVISGKVVLQAPVSKTATLKYKAADFMWFEDTSPYKDQIVILVNKIENENTNCETADTTSVAQSGSRSKPGDPVFFVTCDSGSGPFNVWFRPGDAEKVFTALRPIERHAAANACEAYAKSAATYSSTVKFSRLMDLGFSTYPSGRARVVSSFTAKNGFNLELKYKIDCLFEGSNLLEANIFEYTG